MDNKPHIRLHYTQRGDYYATVLHARKGPYAFKTVLYSPSDLVALYQDLAWWLTPGTHARSYLLGKY